MIESRLEARAMLEPVDDAAHHLLDVLASDHGAQKEFAAFDARLIAVERTRRRTFERPALEIEARRVAWTQVVFALLVVVERAAQMCAGRSERDHVPAGLL